MSDKKGGASVWVLAVVLIVVAIILYFLFFRGGEPAGIVNPSLTIEDQQSSDQLLIKSVYLDKAGFVVVHKDEGGKPGEVIGNSELFSGEVRNPLVSVDESKLGSRVFVMLHYDNGDGVYTSLDEDKPVLVEGSVVVKAVAILAEQPAPSTANVVEITASGFSPGSITISSGESVTWVNKDSEDHWPASAFHPTHTNYPGSSASKCDGPDEANTFDACRGLPTNGTYTFVFTKKGSWQYHDHLNPGTQGSVIVE